MVFDPYWMNNYRPFDWFMQGWRDYQPTQDFRRRPEPLEPPEPIKEPEKIPTGPKFAGKKFEPIAGSKRWQEMYPGQTPPAMTQYDPRFVAQQGQDIATKLSMLQSMPLAQLLASLPQYTASLGGQKGGFMDWLLGGAVTPEQFSQAGIGYQTPLWAQVLASLGGKAGTGLKQDWTNFFQPTTPTTTPTIPTSTPPTGAGPTFPDNWKKAWDEYLGL